MTNTQKQNLAYLLLSDGLDILVEFYEEKVEIMGWTVGVEVPEYPEASEQLVKWSQHLFGMANAAGERVKAQIERENEEWNAA